MLPILSAKAQWVGSASMNDWQMRTLGDWRKIGVDYWRRLFSWKIIVGTGDGRLG